MRAWVLEHRRGSAGSHVARVGDGHVLPEYVRLGPEGGLQDVAVHGVVPRRLGVLRRSIVAGRPAGNVLHVAEFVLQLEVRAALLPERGVVVVSKAGTLGVWQRLDEWLRSVSREACGREGRAYPHGVRHDSGALLDLEQAVAQDAGVGVQRLVVDVVQQDVSKAVLEGKAGDSLDGAGGSRSARHGRRRGAR